MNIVDFNNIWCAQEPAVCQKASVVANWFGLLAFLMLQKFKLAKMVHNSLILHMHSYKCMWLHNMRFKGTFWISASKGEPIDRVCSLLTSAHATLLAAVLKRLAGVTSASWSQHFLNIKRNKRYQHIKPLRQGTPCLWLISRVKTTLNSQLAVKWAIMSATRAAHRWIVKNIDTFIYKVLFRVLKEASHNHQKRKYHHQAWVAVIIHKLDIWNHHLLKVWCIIMREYIVLK